MMYKKYTAVISLALVATWTTELWNKE